MNKRIPLWMAISVSLMLCAAVMAGTFFYTLSTFKRLRGNEAEMFAKLGEISQKISQEFYKDVDADSLQDAAIKGFINGLGDKYAAYYSAEDTDENTANLQGKNKGIGIYYIVDPETGHLYVQRVHSNSPAHKAGIEAGDYIIKMAGEEFNTENHDEVISALDEFGVAVSVELQKKDGTTAVVEVATADYNGQSVWWEMIDNMGYIFIDKFDDTTPQQLKEAVEQVKDAQGIVFDLRSNPGGTVNSVAECLDYLLPSGDLIVATYRDSSSKVLKSSDANAALNVPAVVVVNGQTASSAEVFALAMRDIISAPVIGETTFGKGVMQTTYYFDDGSSYKFSTATITSHNRVGYNGEGIIPDVTIEPSDEEKLDAAMAPISRDPVIISALEVLGDMAEN